MSSINSFLGGGPWRVAALAALWGNWPEYLVEAWGLGVLMLSGAAVAAITQAPGLGFAHLAGPFWLRLAGGGTVAAMAALLTYSRWGRQSGAHFNPATTLTFFLMGKVRPWDALFYVLFQTLGAAAGLCAAAACFGDILRMPPVDWLATYPTGMRTALPFIAEFLASFGVMSLILATGATLRAARYTGLAAVAATFLLGLFDVSASAGFSLNPARSLVSAVPSGHWDGFWIYLLAPPAGMVLAAFVNRRVLPLPPMLCAKLVHDGSTRCYPLRLSAHTAGEQGNGVPGGCCHGAEGRPAANSRVMEIMRRSGSQAPEARAIEVRASVARTSTRRFRLSQGSPLIQGPVPAPVPCPVRRGR